MQDLSCTYLAHHELESIITMISIIIIIILVVNKNNNKNKNKNNSCYNYTCGVQTSTANLERVRKMKTRHQRLQTRVTTVREELQSFLEDDDDMMKMCLTHKMEQGQNQELVRAQG